MSRALVDAVRELAAFVTDRTDVALAVKEKINACEDAALAAPEDDPALLARPVDRERLADKLYRVFDPVAMLAWEQLSDEYREQWRDRADSILREVGR